jgi:malonyl-CoA O-methyltransferase
MSIAEKRLIKKRFGRSCNTYNNHAVVQDHVAHRLSGLLSITGNHSFKHLLEIGCGTGILTKHLLANYEIHNYILNDLVDSSIQDVKNTIGNLRFNNYDFIPGDAEKILFPAGINAILSSSCFQWFNNLELFIMRICNQLKSKGVFAFSTYGQDNFKEIRSLVNVGLNYSTINKHVELLKGDFEIIHTEEWRQQLNFNNPNDVLRHIKYTGVNGLGYGYFGKTRLNEFISEYRQLYENHDNTVSLTYHPIIIIAQKKQ